MSAESSLPFEVMRASKELRRDYERHRSALEAHSFDLSLGPPESSCLYWECVYMAWSRARWLDLASGGKTTLESDLVASQKEKGFENAAQSIVEARWPSTAIHMPLSRAALLMPVIEEMLRFQPLKKVLERFKDSMFAATGECDEHWFNELSRVICNAKRRKKSNCVPLRLIVTDCWLPLGLWKLGDDAIRARLRKFFPGRSVTAKQVKTARTQSPRLHSEEYDGR